MALDLIGQTVSASTTIAASPASTTQTLYVVSSNGFSPGAIVMVNGVDEERIQSVSGNTITLAAPLGSAPSSGQTVENYSAEVTNETFNLIIEAVNDLMSGGQTPSLPEAGTGRHGLGCLGSIPTNASGTVVAVAGTAGAISGTVRYRAAYANLSGHTTATADPGVDITVSNKRVDLSGIPVSGDSTTAWREIYRSKDSGGTWHLVGIIYNNTDTTWTDNNPYTGGASVPGSNNTGNTATLNGDWEFTSFSVESGQTLTINDDNTNGNGGILIVRCTGTANIAGTITGTGKFARTSGPDCGYSSFYNVSTTQVQANFSTGTGGAPGASSGSNWLPRSVTLGYQEGGFGGVAGSSTCFGSAFIYNLNRQGTGGPYLTVSDRAAAGATFAVIAQGAITSSGTVNCLGAAGSTASSGEAGRGGGAGGTIYYESATSITHTGTRNVTGGAGSNAVTDGSGFTAWGGGGGGGGGIADNAPIVIDTGTNTKSGGAAGTSASCTSNNKAGGSGGANAGNGGYSGAGSSAAGGTGSQITIRNKPGVFRLVA